MSGAFLVPGLLLHTTDKQVTISRKCLTSWTYWTISCVDKWHNFDILHRSLDLLSMGWTALQELCVYCQPFRCGYENRNELRCLMDDITYVYKQKYLYRQSQDSKTWNSKWLAPVSQMIDIRHESEGWGSIPPWVVTSSASQRWHFHNITRSLVIKECWCLGAVDHYQQNCIYHIKIHTNDAFSITTFFQQNPKVDLNPLNVNILSVVEFQLLWWTSKLRIFLYSISIKTTSCMILLVSETPYIKNIALELNPCDICKWRYYDF